MAPRTGANNELVQTWMRSKFKFEMRVYYMKAGSAGPGDLDSDKDRIKMLLKMPDQMWFAIGFGTSMYKTDMIVWHANGENSTVTDYFSNGKYKPSVDAEQNVQYFVNMVEADEDDPEDYPKVHFLVYRDLDTGDTDKDFLIEVNSEIDMVYGIYLSSSKFKEHTTRGYWKLDFNESLGNGLDLIDIEAGDLASNTRLEISKGSGPRTPISQLKCQEFEWDGENFEVFTCFDISADELVFKVVIPDNSWFGIGFGDSMSDTDMIAWFVKDGVGRVEDQYST